MNMFFRFIFNSFHGSKAIFRIYITLLLWKELNTGILSCQGLDFERFNSLYLINLSLNFALEDQDIYFTLTGNRTIVKNNTVRTL